VLNKSLVILLFACGGDVGDGPDGAAGCGKLRVTDASMAEEMSGEAETAVIGSGSVASCETGSVRTCAVAVSDSCEGSWDTVPGVVLPPS